MRGRGAVSRNGWWGLILLLLAGLGAGCAAAPKRPAYLDDPALHPVYGAGGYLTAVGMSATSREEAELQARKRVSEQIMSSLKAVDAERLLEARGDGGEKSLAEYTSVIETRTDFDRAELIRVEPSAGYRDGNVWYAYAYLGKEDLRKAIEPEYAKKAGEFRAYAARADEAYGSLDLQGFAAAWRGAQAAFVALEPMARMLFVAQGGPYAPHRRIERRFLVLLDRKLALRDRLRFHLVLDGPRSAYGRQRLEAIFQGFFDRAGLKASFCSACACSGPLDFTFKVVAREKQQSGLLGPVFRLSLDAKVLLCETERSVMDLELCAREPRGAHTSDPDRALRNLYDQLDENALYEAFRRSMAVHFGVGE